MRRFSRRVLLRPISHDLWSGALVALSLAGCSTAFEPQPCALDTDCGTGLRLRAPRASAPVCVHAEDAPLVIGHERARQRHQPGARHRHEARHRARVRGAERRRRHSRAAARARRSATTRTCPSSPRAAARTLVDAQPMDAAPRCPTTTTSAVAGQPPISSTRARARPERGARVHRQRRHADDGALRRPSRSRPARSSSARSPARRRSCATTKAGGLQAYIFNVRASYAQEARATMEFFKKRSVPDVQAPDQLRPERLVRAGRLRRARRGVQGRRSARSRRRGSDHADRALPLHAQRRHERAGAGRGRRGVPRAACC